MPKSNQHLPQFTQLLLKPTFTIIRIGQFFLAIGIFYFFALMPADDTPSNYPDELLHFMGNLLLMGSAYVAVFHKTTLLKTLTVCVFLSGIAELCQSFTASRVTDPADLVVNSLGLAIGYLICKGFQVALKLDVGTGSDLGN